MLIDGNGAAGWCKILDVNPIRGRIAVADSSLSGRGSAW